MVNFKVGDAVKRVYNYDAPGGLPVGEVGIVSVLRGTGFVEIEGYGGWLHNTENLESVTWDDELPPAPESVMYFNSIRDERNDQCITAGPDNDPYYAGTLCTSVHPRGDYAGYQSVSLDPDAALQLAHDLRRMAMEIRRKEKQG